MNRRKMLSNSRDFRVLRSAFLDCKAGISLQEGLFDYGGG